LSHIFENAVDSLEVGMSFYLSGNQYRTRKHSILTVFHSIELFLKEYLYQVNPVLIYKNIDRKINNNSMTVGFTEILIRLENLKLKIPEDEAKVIRNLQEKRNQIEHHRYNKEDEDKELISKSLKFILYFMEFQLLKKPEAFIEPNILSDIRELISDSNERDGVAEYRLNTWLKETWNEWEKEKTDSPEDFQGTYSCPSCRNDYLVIEQIDDPFCFWCNHSIPVELCEICGGTTIEGVPCCDEPGPYLYAVK